MGWDWGSIFEAAATALGAYSDYEKGQEQKKALKDQANVSAQNAALDRQRAADATRRGVIEADRAAQRKRALIGRQRAAMGASGVDVGSGTFSDVLSDTAAAGAEDESTIMQNALREAWGYTARSGQESNEASSARRAGKRAGQAGLLGGLGTLASGTYQMGQKRKWWES
jgi:uncharacterized membrane protein YebE (DUF533 family)